MSPSSGLVGFLAWVEVHKKRLLIGTATGLVVLFVAIVLIQQQAQKEVHASQALSEVRVPFSAASAIPAGTADALAKVAEEHKGTKAAARALLLSAGVLYAENNPKSYADAQARFTQLLQNYPNSPWTAEANLGVAACLAAQGKTAEAVAKYEEIRKRFANSTIIDEAKLALARLYEAQKPEDAFRLYDELAKGGTAGTMAGMGGGPTVVEASMRMDDLLKAKPELAKLREELNPAPAAPIPSKPQTITLTNRLASMASNAVNRVLTNTQRLALTNLSPATNQAIPIKLSPPK